MQPSAVSKVVAAFVGGALFAVGGAFLYSHVNEPVHVESRHSPVVSVASFAPVTSPEPVIAPGAANEPQPDIEKPVRAVVNENPKRRPKSSRRPPDSAQATHEMAQNLLPAPASPATEPAPPPVNSAPASATPEPSVASATAPAYAPPAVREPHVVTLPPGTNISVRLLQPLSSEHNSSGDDFRATLEKPVIVDGFIIADRGSKVLGRVTEATRAGRVQGLSGLVLTLTEINTTDGQRVPVTTDNFERRGVASAGQDAGKMAGAAAVGALIGALAGGGKGAAIGAGAGGAAGTGIVLGTRGKPVTLPVETDLSFRLGAPVTITEHFK